jgi:hypothetical protein
MDVVMKWKVSNDATARKLIPGDPLTLDNELLQNLHNISGPVKIH